MHTISRRSVPGSVADRLQELAALVVDWLVFAADRIVTWQARRRERRMLAELDDRALHDLGLTRGDVLRECSKRFWQT